MKDRWTFAVLAVAGIVFLGGVPADLPAAETGVEAPEPSYSNQWADLDRRSTPFLNLRNESSGDTVATPEAPDTPPAETVNVDGETVVVPGPDAEDTVPEEVSAERSSDTGTKPTEDTVPGEVAESGTEPEDSSVPEDTGGTTTDTESASTEVAENEETPEDRGTEDSETTPGTDPSEVTGDTDGEPEDEGTDRVDPDTIDRPGESDVEETPARSRGRVAGSVFDRTRPADTGPILYEPSMADSGIPSGTVPVGSVRSEFGPLTAEEYPRTPPPFWWKYYWWIIGGLVVTVTIGMFFWFRRRRVEVVETSYSSADTFFQEQLERKREPVIPGGASPAPDRTDNPVEKSRVDVGASAPTGKPGIEYGRLAERIREEGYEGEFERMLKLYYEDNMDETQIAERTSRGAGAVGLVLDYADRLRKDLDHGKRA